MKEKTCASPVAAGMVPKPAGHDSVDEKDTTTSLSSVARLTAEPSGPQVGAGNK